MNYDIIETLYEPTGNILTDSEGFEYPETAPIQGYHVNTTQKLVGLDAYLVTPSTPRRVFAGVVTHCYAFPDQSFWLSLGTESEQGWTLKPEYIPLNDDAHVTDPVSSTGVPLAVTKRQGRQQLILMGLTDHVQMAIDAIPDTTQRLLVQSFWDDSTQYERYHPQMIQLAQAVGMTDEELDHAFIAADKLKG